MPIEVSPNWLSHQCWFKAEAFDTWNAGAVKSAHRVRNLARDRQSILAFAGWKIGGVMSIKRKIVSAHRETRKTGVTDIPTSLGACGALSTRNKNTCIATKYYPKNGTMHRERNNKKLDSHESFIRKSIFFVRQEILFSSFSLFVHIVYVYVTKSRLQHSTPVTYLWNVIWNSCSTYPEKCGEMSVCVCARVRLRVSNVCAVWYAQAQCSGN